MRLATPDVPCTFRERSNPAAGIWNVYTNRPNAADQREDGDDKVLVRIYQKCLLYTLVHDGPFEGRLYLGWVFFPVEFVITRIGTERLGYGALHAMVETLATFGTRVTDARPPLPSVSLGTSKAGVAVTPASPTPKRSPFLTNANTTLCGAYSVGQDTFLVSEITLQSSLSGGE